MADREMLIELHSVLCRSLYAEYDEAQRATVIDLLKTAENLIANGVVVSNSETATKWIPVTERLPEDSRDVILCTRSRIVGVGFCDKNTRNWNQHYSGGGICVDVTHWMPLPEAPKGE